jgi:hypothetical protein
MVGWDTAGRALRGGAAKSLMIISFFQIQSFGFNGLSQKLLFP